MSMRTKFENWCLDYSGCDGGDIGNPQNKSTWVCGIEWGGGHDPEGLLEHMNQNLTEPPRGYDTWEENISYIFNWQVMKLFSAIYGGTVDDYKVFAEQTKPFVSGSNGFFKLKLLFLYGLAIIAGALIPVQAATNAMLSKVTGHVLYSSLILFGVGMTLVLVFILLFRPSASEITMDSLWTSMPIKSILDCVMSISEPVNEWVTPSYYGTGYF